MLLVLEAAVKDKNDAIDVIMMLGVVKIALPISKRTKKLFSV